MLDFNSNLYICSLIQLSLHACMKMLENATFFKEKLRWLKKKFHKTQI
jgi:hypothetical protein